MNNYQKYFGTPELVAKVYDDMGLCPVCELADIECDSEGNNPCQFYDSCDGSNAIIDWLKQERER